MSPFSNLLALLTIIKIAVNIKIVVGSIGLVNKKKFEPNLIILLIKYTPRTRLKKELYDKLTGASQVGTLKEFTRFCVLQNVASAQNNLGKPR